MVLERRETQRTSCGAAMWMGCILKLTTPQNYGELGDVRPHLMQILFEKLDSFDAANSKPHFNSFQDYTCHTMAPCRLIAQRRYTTGHLL